MRHVHLQVDLEASYRQNPSGDFCCYLTAVATTPRGQRRILDSRHFAARDPEALMDEVARTRRSWEVEYFLTVTEPF
jgi:hypothetical protein